MAIVGIVKYTNLYFQNYAEDKYQEAEKAASRKSSRRKPASSNAAPPSSLGFSDAEIRR